MSLHYGSPGCDGTVAPVCGGPPPPCATSACSCNGVTILGCQVYLEPYAHEGPCADAGSDGGECPSGWAFYYSKPGCGGTVAPECSPPPPPCVTYACSCDGKTISDCGAYREPWAHAGPCADAGDDGG